MWIKAKFKLLRLYPKLVTVFLTVLNAMEWGISATMCRLDIRSLAKWNAVGMLKQALIKVLYKPARSIRVSA